MLFTLLNLNTINHLKILYYENLKNRTKCVPRDFDNVPQLLKNKTLY